MSTQPATDDRGMALSQVGNAADTAADAAADAASPVAETVRRRGIPQQLARHPDDDALLAAVHAGLTPGDPVALLLARWTAPPVRPVVTHTARGRSAQLDP